ncbi:hypothetical protein [Megalodesulfovibrio paquesii]
MTLLSNCMTLRWVCGTPRDRVFWIIIALGHLYGLSLGATFWVDSEAYILSAEYFRGIDSASRLLHSGLSLVYSHTPWGMGLVWRVVELLPQHWIWPALALFQHAVAALAQGYLFLTLNKAWPSRVHLVFCATLSFLPFYQAMHNALMTESLNSSFCVLGAVFLLRILKDIGNGKWAFGLFLTCSSLALQLRVQSVLFLFFGCCVLLFLRKISIRQVLAGACVCMLAFWAFPLYKYALGGELKPLSLTVWHLNFASQFAKQNPRVLRDEAVALGLPAMHAPAFGEYLSREAIVDIGDQWIGAGMSESQVEGAAIRILNKVKESNDYTLVHRLAGGLASFGVVSPLAMLPEHTRFWGNAPARFQEAQLKHYRYLSWVAPSESEYAALTDKYFFPRAVGASSERLNHPRLTYDDFAETKAFFLKVWGPYLRFSDASWFRDPLLLGRVWPDVFVLFGVAGIIYLGCKREWFAAYLGLCYAGIFFVFASIDAFTIRMAYLTIVLSFCASSPACALLAKGFCNHESS